MSCDAKDRGHGGVTRAQIALVALFAAFVTFVKYATSSSYSPDEIESYRSKKNPPAPTLILAVDIDYPPYAYLKQPPYESKYDLDSPIGVGVDMVRAMGEHCGFKVEIMQAHWRDCWNKDEIGRGLLEGWYHGCMTYTHAAGARNRYVEFTNSWARLNKPSGLITRLDANGVPHLKGHDTLAGRTIVDVSGWAPTADTLHFVNNECTGEKFDHTFTVVQGDEVKLPETGRWPASLALGANDRALLAVLNGLADGMWVYGDQASNYKCKDGTWQDGWNCKLWNSFGKDFAYVQSGMFGWMHNGTTVAMAKKGTGIAQMLDGCLDSFMQTSRYLEVCKVLHGDPAHSQVKNCVPNEYFKDDADWKPDDPREEPYMFSTRMLARHGHSCSTGYCTCLE